jgi:hypothetical protein
MPKNQRILDIKFYKQRPKINQGDEKQSGNFGKPGFLVNNAQLKPAAESG